MNNLPSSTIHFLSYFMKMQIRGFFLLVVTAVFWAINQAFFPYFIRTIINILEHASQYKIYNKLFYPLVGLAIVWIFAEFSNRIQGYLIAEVLPKFQANIRSAVFTRVQDFSMSYISKQSFGEMANKLVALPHNCYMIILILLFNFLPILLSFIFSIILISMLASPVYASIVVSWFTVYIGIAIFTAKKCSQYSLTYASQTSRLSGLLFDNITNALLVKLFTNQSYEKKRFIHLQHQEIESAAHLGRYIEKIKIVLSLLSLLMLTSLLFFAIHACINNRMNIGDFTLIIMLSFNMLGLTWAFAQQIPMFYKQLGMIKEGVDLVSDYSNSVAPVKRMEDSLEVITGSIEFRNINFQYQHQNMLFKNLSFFIPGKQKVGIVGVSGSGKSTLIKLLLRLYEIESGCIVIDGQDLRHVTAESLFKQIAIIPQEPQLFNRSIFDNIAYGSLSASMEDVIRVSKIALCHDFIMDLNNKYDSLVGEFGVCLSAGQRQRIAIARAILKESQIIIFDEPTSALDLVTEQALHQNLIDISVHKTVIVIAHKLETLVNLDRILVFSKGNIVEEGTHRALLAKNGLYASTWFSQMKRLTPEQVF